MNTFTRVDLCQAIQETLGLSQVDCMEIVEEILDLVVQGLERDGQVKITHFGTFDLVERKKSIGRNMKTGEPIAIPARKTVRFKASNHLKNDLINASSA